MDEVEICRIVEGNEARAYLGLLESAPAAIRAQYDLNVQRVGGAYAFVAGGVRDSLMLNRVIGLGVWQPSTLEHVAQLDHIYRSHGIDSYAVEVAPTGPTGLSTQDLQSLGLMPFKRTTMMFRDCSASQTAASSLVVREVGEEFSESFASLCCSVFALADPFPQLLRDSFRRPDMQHWMAFDGNQPVAAALTVEFDSQLAWIGWVCTLPSHRGRGAQAALASAQLHGCGSRGVSCVTLEAATGTKRRPSQSLRNYTRLGWHATYDRLVLLRRLEV